LIIVVPMIWFAIRYRRKSSHLQALTQKDKNHLLEIGWTIAPMFYLAVLFVWGFYGYLDLSLAPMGAKELRVVGQKWSWSVTYPGEGINVSGQGAVIGIPLGEPVKLVMSSQDVIHSFSVPNFRVKQDVVPGRYTTLWFNANKVGEYPVFCTEYCGVQHSNMLAKIKVMPKAEYASWVLETKNASVGLSPQKLGAKLYKDKACLACHTLDGSKSVGPSFKSLYGTTHQTVDGRQVTVDDQRIRQKLLDPRKDITMGYAPVMPIFKGQLSEADIIGIIEFIKTLK